MFGAKDAFHLVNTSRILTFKLAKRSNAKRIIVPITSWSNILTLKIFKQSKDNELQAITIFLQIVALCAVQVSNNLLLHVVTYA